MNSQFPTNCPKGTFQPAKNQSGIDDCRPCLGGFHCDGVGLGNILKFEDKYRCPLGHYCPMGSTLKPIPCLAGTFTDETAVDSKSGSEKFSADSLNDCNYCPEHYYCERGTNYRFQYPCKDGYLCPKGSGAMIACEAGFYCKRDKDVMVQTVCPQGYYCPVGSSEPRKCDPNQFCPEKSVSPAQGGMTRYDCKPGEYLNVNICEKCLPGFVCN
jgi:hypothetical protein